MKIRFDPDFDAGAWPGPLGGRVAVAGEAWLGPVGLLDHLETELGLRGRFDSTSERAAELVPRLQATTGFWDASVKLDPLGSARELLRWRDALALEGWNPEANQTERRLVDLAGVSRDLPVGPADRLLSVNQALADCPSEIEDLGMFEPREHLPALWRLVIERLEAGSTRVVEKAVAPAAALGDLAAAREVPFVPSFDGRLQLLRADAPWMAAEEVAAWLVAATGTEETVVIAPTALLDREFHRAGLPTLGSREARGGGALLEMLPLVLMVGFGPADPADVQALLTLARSPLPPALSRALNGALAAWPAVGSPAWAERLEEGLARIEDEGRRLRVAKLVAQLFSPAVHRGGEAQFSHEHVRDRVGLVRERLGAFRAGVEKDGDPTMPYDRALAFIAAFESVVERSGVEHFSEADLHRFLAQARAGIPSEEVLPAEAGLSRISAPGAIVGPARRIVWWDFCRETAPRPRRLPFTRAEREALARAGVHLPDPATQAQRLATRWRRPLEQATGELLLVSPRSCEAGEERHPHPLWDEVCARLAEGAERARFSAGSPRILGGAERVERQVEPLPIPQRCWRVGPESVPQRARLSHTAVEKLLSCPLRYTLDYGGRLRASSARSLRIDNRVLGSLGHAMLAEVMPKVGSDEAAARNAAQAWLDENGPLLTAELYLPGREPARHRVTRTLKEASAALARFLRVNDLHLEQAEAELEASGLGGTLTGRLDLLLGPRPAVLDAKWGGLRRHRQGLEEGTASQLAFYGRLIGRPGETSVAVGYFILTEQLVLTPDPSIAEGAVRVDGEDWSVTWVSLERAYDQRREELSGGQLEAPGNPDQEGNTTPEQSGIDPEGRLVLVPGCRYCDYSGLCGHAFVEGAP